MADRDTSPAYRLLSPAGVKMLATIQREAARNGGVVKSSADRLARLSGLAGGDGSHAVQRLEALWLHRARIGRSGAACFGRRNAGDPTGDRNRRRLGKASCGDEADAVAAAFQLPRRLKASGARRFHSHLKRSGVFQNHKSTTGVETPTFDNGSTLHFSRVISTACKHQSGFVIGRNSPGEGLVGDSNGRERVTPGEPPVLTIDYKGELEVADARRTSNGLRAWMMRVVAEDDRLSFPRPGALEIGDRILCTRCRHQSPPVPVRKQDISSVSLLLLTVPPKPASY